MLVCGMGMWSGMLCVAGVEVVFEYLLCCPVQLCRCTVQGDTSSSANDVANIGCLEHTAMADGLLKPRPLRPFVAWLHLRVAERSCIELVVV